MHVFPVLKLIVMGREGRLNFYPLPVEYAENRTRRQSKGLADPRLPSLMAYNTATNDLGH